MFSLMRCKCCNRKMFPTEVNSKKPRSRDEYEDLCNICKGAAKSEYNIVEDKEYQHENLQEGLSPALFNNE